MEELADQFVRVRLTRVDNQDLNLFEFDYDLTFIVFFLDAEGHVYARYGGRDAQNADHRHSLAGLQATMRSVLASHHSDTPRYAPQSPAEPRYLPRRGGRGCLHCHQIKEALHAELRASDRWVRDLVFRYPLPENVGLRLDVDQPTRVRTVRDASPAAVAGIQADDELLVVFDIPIHSSGDVQFALDRAPASGEISVAWQRGEQVHEGVLRLEPGWRKTDVSWRPSLRELLPTLRVYGTDLTTAEKAALGLPPQRLAYRQKDAVPPQAKAAGIQAGDVILGFDGLELEMTMNRFVKYVRTNYLVGDQVLVNVLRDGQRLDFRMTLHR